MRTMPVASSLKFNNHFRANEQNNVENLAGATSDKSLTKNIRYSKETIVTSGLALTALAVSSFALMKKSKVNNAEMQQALQNSLKNEIESLKREIELLKGKLNSKSDNSSLQDLIDKFTTLSGSMSELTKNGKKLDSECASIMKALSDLGSKISTEAGFVSKTLSINGNVIPLVADVMSRVEGDTNVAMEKTLRAEAAKRIFGIGAGQQVLPESGMIRIPTSEIRPYSSTGGMSIVPKEVAENLAKLLAGKQGLQVVVDSPLYLGRMEKEAFQKLVEIPNTGKFRYIREALDKKVGIWKKKELAELELLDTVRIPVITDKGVTEETVRIFRAEKDIPLDFKTIESEMSPEVLAEMRRVLDEGNVYRTKGLTVVPLKNGEKGDPRAYATVQNIFYDNRKFYLDTPIETYSLDEHGNRSLDPINIYTNKAYTAGETERFMYFDKFFYEYLLRGEQSKTPLTAELIIGNDWQTGGISAMIRQLTTVRRNYDIAPELADKIQNTPIVTIMHNAGLSGGAWHSQAKLMNILFGEHAAVVAENSWMPNVYYKAEQNGISFLHEGLPAHLQNALMEGKGFNPQMMAAAYSDFLVPVSESYGNEIATQDFYGGARKQIFALRARIGEFYGKPENIKNIAEQNGLTESDLINSAPTLRGILNGCDRSNNSLTEKIIEDDILKFADVSKEQIKPYAEGKSVLSWHNDNKSAMLPTYISGVDRFRQFGESDNPLKLIEGKYMLDGVEKTTTTDLSGVTVNTPWISSAGRIVEQKGIENYVNGIEYWCDNYYRKGDEIPVFWLNGSGDEKYFKLFLDAKSRIAQKYPEVANRMVCSKLFSEDGAYSSIKLVSDATAMPSNFEPCGLVHKEIAQFSGAVPIVNRTGGLVEGLEEGVDTFVSEYRPKDLKYNGESFGKAINEFLTAYKDKSKLDSMMTAVFSKNYDWLAEGGSMDKYLEVISGLGVIRKDLRTSKIS